MRGFKAVLFDCDGVLADSEHLVDRVVSEDLTARGWALTPQESGAVFLGMALPDMAPVVKAKLGHLPPDWTQELKRKVTETMAREVPPVPGAEALLRRLRRSPCPLPSPPTPPGSNSPPSSAGWASRRISAAGSSPSRMWRGPSRIPTSTSPRRRPAARRRRIAR